MSIRGAIGFGSSRIRSFSRAVSPTVIPRIEIGEPEGVRTIIVDLVVGRNRGPDGGAYEICRLGAEPGEEAMELATAIERALAPQSSAPSIKSLAAEGTPSRWYQNIEEFESAALESLDP